jgi:hypothetical protein
MEPVAKRQFCNFNGVDRLCQNEAGRYFGAGGEMEGADRNGVLQLPPQWSKYEFAAKALKKIHNRQIGSST